ncbi:hypothetical protein [Microbulbifer sp. JMSA008]|uniref:hypothetical protein n=1 Tax=Microbulbifer sp. JMSA008 TaxID=3243373 RepID=UPI00403A5D82
MINAKDNPVEWPLMLMELGEIKEQIEPLANQMKNDGLIDDEDFKVQIFHTISHLNRLWNGRNQVGEIGQDLHSELSKTPADFIPLG